MASRDGRNRSRGPRLGEGSRIQVSLPDELRVAVRACAEAEGVSESLWLRRAAQERALRQAAGDVGLLDKLLKA